MEEIQLSIPGINIAGLAWGPVEGQRVLAMHGWLDTAGSFSRLAPLLPGCRIVAVDLPGHGRSDHLPAASTFHFSGWLQTVDQLLRALDWETCTLMGHSMGGGIASLYAGVVPEAVERLVLLEGLAPLSAEAEDAPSRARRGLEQNRLTPTKRPRVYATRAEAVARYAAAVPTLDEAGREAIVARGVAEVEGGWAYTHDLRLRTSSLARFTEEQVLAFLAAIACPVLIVKAREGLAFPEAMVRRRVAAIPNARVEEIDGAHHNHLTHATEVATCVQAFLEAPLDARPEAGAGSER